MKRIAAIASALILALPATSLAGPADTLDQIGDWFNQVISSIALWEGTSDADQEDVINVPVNTGMEGNGSQVINVPVNTGMEGNGSQVINVPVNTGMEGNGAD